MSIKPIEATAVCSCDALLQDFEGELFQQGYKPSTVHKKKKLFADLIDWLWAQELTTGDLSFRLADRFLFIGENPRLCRGDSQSLTFPGYCNTPSPVLGF
jgi:hypothetical protein